MGIVVYFPAVAPPDAYAGLLADKRGSSVMAVVVTVAVVARKKCLRVVNGCASRSLFSVLDADNWMDTPDVLRLLFAVTDNDDVGGAEKAWISATTTVRRRDRASSFVMVTNNVIGGSGFDKEVGSTIKERDCDHLLTSLAISPNRSPSRASLRQV